MRQIVLDTETTGLEPADGHRVIELGCFELSHRRPTGRTFHEYLNPERPVDAEAVEVHGLDDAFLADKPRFAEVAQAFFEFIAGAELIIHNAPFDVGFLNHELSLLGEAWGRIEDHCGVTDTLALAREMHPGQRNSLDALCRRYGVDNSGRTLHGALLDAEILAEVYLAMTGGQTRLVLGEAAGGGRDTLAVAGLAERLAAADRRPRVVRAAEAELEAHRGYLERLSRSAEEGSVWERVADIYGA